MFYVFELMIIWKQVIEGFIKDINLAAMGRVSPALLPPVQLKANVYHDFVIISVPFQPQTSYTLYRMHSFPVEMDGSYYLYNIEHPNIIVNDDPDMYSHPSDEILAKCYHTQHELILCPSFLFTFYTPTERPCEISMIKKLEYESKCIFKEYTSVEPFIAHTRQLHYIHLPKRTAITVKCPSRPVKMTELQGTFVLPTTCTLLSNELHIFPHHIYLGDVNVKLPSPEIFVIRSKVLELPVGNVSTAGDQLKEKIHLDRRFIKIQRDMIEEIDSSSPVTDSIKVHSYITSGVTTLIICTILTMVGIVCFLNFRKRVTFLTQLKEETLHTQRVAENSNPEEEEEEDDTSKD